jgi:hypothetical protein
MTPRYSRTVARLAGEVQHLHRADAEGFCAHRRRHFHVRIPFGTCAPWRLAQLIIVGHAQQQQARPLPQGPVAGQAAGQYWTREA